MKFYQKLRWGFCVLMIGFSVLAGNLINNGNFEIAADKNNFPDRWRIITKGGCKYVKTTDIAGKATSCLEFDLDGKQTRIESSPVLKAGRKYRLAVDMKTENFKGGGGVYVTPLRWTWGQTIIIPKGTSGWKRYTLEFSIPEKQEKAYRLILFAKNGTGGKVWFDNVELEEIIPELAQNNAFISAGRMAEPPVIDGNLNDRGWTSTIEAAPFEKIGNYDFSALAYEQSGVRVGYDDKNLYFCFKCRQRCLEPVRNALDDFRCDVKKHDGEMWKQDCVLVMLKTGTDDSFFEIIVNGAGTVTDALCKGPDYWTSGRKLDWESNAQAAVKTGNGVWNVEIAIPLKQLNLNAVKGTVLQACLGRLNVSGNERSSYFPMRQGFHSPQYFGRVKLGPALPDISELALGALKSGNNEFSFKAGAASDSRLELNITTMDAASRETSINKAYQLKTVSTDYNAEYVCNGKDYSFMRFSFSDANGIFWSSPQYSRVNSSQEIAILVDGKKDGNVALNGQPMNREAVADGTGYKTSCEPGLYEVSGLDGNFALSANGFTLPVVKGMADTKIMVDMTKFWPEDGNYFHIAENSLQPMHVVLHNPYEKLENSSYSFNLAMPEEFKLAGASGAYRKYKTLPVKKLPEIVCNGKKFQHLQITVPGGLPYKPYYEEADGMTLMIELPTSGKSFKRRAAEFYAWSEFNNGTAVEAPQQMSIDILPPLKDMMPKHFMTQMWGGRIVNLNDTGLIRQFMQRTVAGCGFNDLQGGPALVEGTNMTTFAVLNFRSTWGKEADELLKQHPEYTLVDYLGEPVGEGAYNRICSTIMLENSEMHKIMSETILRRYKQYDYINFDYENPVTTGPLSCYCKRCLGHFRQEAKISADEALDYKIIQGKYQEEWTRFMNRKLAALTGIFRKEAHAIGRKLTFYSGYQSRKTLVQYGVDWKLIGAEIDYALCGYRTSSEIIRNTIDALGQTPLITGVIAAPWIFTSREQSRQIDKAFIIKGIVLGSKGYLCYNLPQLDGRSYYALSEAAAMLAGYEDIIYFGKINNKWLSVEGLAEDQYALFEKAGSKKRVLVIYNEDIKKPVKFKVSMKGKNYKVYDYFSGKYLSLDNQAFEGAVAPQDFNTYCIEEN